MILYDLHPCSNFSASLSILTWPLSRYPKAQIVCMISDFKLPYLFAYLLPLDLFALAVNASIDFVKVP